MRTADLKSQAKDMIDSLSRSQLRMAAEFLAFVKSREAFAKGGTPNPGSDAATNELLSIPGFEKSFRQGLSDLKAGRSTRWPGPKQATKKPGHKRGRNV